MEHVRSCTPLPGVSLISGLAIARRIAHVVFPFAFPGGTSPFSATAYQFRASSSVILDASAQGLLHAIPWYSGKTDSSGIFLCLASLGGLNRHMWHGRSHAMLCAALGELCNYSTALWQVA